MALPVHCRGEAGFSVVLSEDVRMGISGGTWGSGKELLHLPHERECLADVGCNLPLFFGKIAHGMVLQLDFNVSQRNDGAVGVHIAAA